MRLILAALTLLATAAATSAQVPRTDGPVAGGAFGMGGSDYYGDVRDGSVSEGRRAAAPPARNRRAVRPVRRHTGIGRPPVR